MKAIVTIAYQLPSWSTHITFPRMAAYAKRIGVGLKVVWPIKYRSFLDRGPIFKQELRYCSRLALIDADCVISRDAPDIFDHPPGKVWMVPDCKEGEINRRWFPQMVAMQAIFGSIGWHEGYGNLGVALVEPGHSEAFDNWCDIPDTNHDQTNFNYLIRKLGFVLGWMDRRWNSMAITVGLPDELSSCATMADGAFIAHPAGFKGEMRGVAIQELNRLMP